MKPPSPSHSPSLRRATAGVPRKHRRFPHVVEAEVQEHHPLQANARARVRTTPVAEAVDVRGQRLRVHPFQL